MNNKSKKNKLKIITKMITVIAAISIIAVFTVSCSWTIGVVRGSGDIETEHRDVSGFHKVLFSGVGNLIITQGEKESLEIEADNNIIPLIETEVLRERLIISFKKGYNFIPTSRIKFYLTVKDLNEISLSGAGDINCDDLNTEELEFEVNGAGDIEFNITADRVEVTLSGAGDIALSGQVNSQDITLTGAGKYDGTNLKSKTCSVTVSGAGSATINVSEELDVDINGVGNVYYMGTPRIEQDISGLGRIKSID